MGQQNNDKQEQKNGCFCPNHFTLPPAGLEIPLGSLINTVG
jgi:hypothetical protein